jgi:parallel beta-helix repeat protein
LEACEAAVIAGNDIYENAYNGIFLVNSDWAYIFDNDIYANSDRGIYAVASDNGTILENNVYENGWWQIQGTTPCGVYLGTDANEWLIQSNQVWNNTPTGIYIAYTTDVDIISNEVFWSIDYGIMCIGSGSSDYINIMNNEVYGNGWALHTAGIAVYGLENCTIHENTVYNNTGSGILSAGFYNFITFNEVYDTIGQGINVEMTQHNLILENLVHDNTEAGVFLYAISTDVIENIIYSNGVGVHLYGASWCNVYKNDIGWNDLNALQESGTDTNLWNWVFDDIGNHWSDYYPPTGEGIDRYGITNGTHIVAFDPFPDQSINLTVASPTSYEILETGNVLYWDAYAKNPRSYTVWIDGEWVFTETWDGGPVTLDVDGLPHGFHEVELVVTHVSGYGRLAESNATVEDLTPPSGIVGPTSINVDYGVAVNTQFSSSDPSGVHWSVNDTVYFAISSTGVLTSGTDLEAGEYPLLISATDPYGHSVTHVVVITVNPPGGMPGTMILVLGGAVAAVVVVVVVVILKKKGS